MNVLLIRSDLPESPEVLLLAGMLASSDDPLGWIPTPEVIVCKLIKIWAWVAEYGHRDSDSWTIGFRLRWSPARETVCLRGVAGRDVFAIDRLVSPRFCSRADDLLSVWRVERRRGDG